MTENDPRSRPHSAERPAERIARLVVDTYSDQALDAMSPGVEHPNVVADVRGFDALAVPRADQDEPFRSFHLIGSVAVGDVVVTTYSWGEVTASEMTYLMPLDVGRLALDRADDVTLENVVTRHVEWTLGGPRESWERERATLLGPGLTVVRSWLQDG